MHRFALRALAWCVLSALFLLGSASPLRGQYTPAQQQPVELADLVSLFLLPESVTTGAGDWYAWSGPASPIAWNPNEVRWDERRQTFVRDGSAIVSVDGRSFQAAGTAEPARWAIRMFGPRDGFTRVAIASRVSLPGLALDLPGQLAAHRVVYEAERCDAAEPAAGNRLFEISWPGYQPAWLHHQWGCDGAGCAAYLSISVTEPEAASLQNMPSTECGLSNRVADAGAGGGPEAAGAALLFKGAPDALTPTAQQEIYASLHLALSADGTGFVDVVCGQPAGADAQVLDLNGDGVSEVMVIYGNTCTSGMAGSSVALFIESSGAYGMHLGFPGAMAEPLATSSGGYPDLLIGGPGFCFPVWRWNGATYVHHKDEPQAPNGCAGERQD